MVINLSQFAAGSEKCLPYIPSGIAGIYSWFQNFRYPTEPTGFLEALIKDIERPKFIERSGTISPYYQVGIRSFGKLGDGKKERIAAAMRDQEFRDYLRHAIGNSILFQSPLYVGKAVDLRKRIRQHLSPDSILRSRLEQVGIAIDQCSLMICPIWKDEVLQDLNSVAFDDSIDTESIQSSDNGSYSVADQYEDLFEEIFSRLFCPQFTIKIG